VEVEISPEGLVCGAARRNLGCRGSEEPEMLAGEYFSYGTYKDVEIASSALKATPVLETGSLKERKILFAPLDFLINQNLAVESVIFVINPYQAMRLIQGYNYYNSFFEVGNLFAMHGVCGELCASVFKGKPTLSLFCSGARHFGNFSENELAISFPGEMLDKVVTGVIETVNSCEDDKRKQKIAKALKREGLDFKLSFRSAYIYPR